MNNHGVWQRAKHYSLVLSITGLILAGLVACSNSQNSGSVSGGTQTPVMRTRTPVTPGVITEFLSNDVGPNGITTGPDGDLWFTEDLLSEIGRITPSGTITNFPIPSDFTGNLGITTGPDGNLWFTSYSESKIG